MIFKIAGNRDQRSSLDYATRNLVVDDVPVDWNDPEDIVNKIKGYDCWINYGQVCTGWMIEALSDNLKMICRSGIGFDQIDIATATRFGICVTNTAGSMNQSVGETALILMLESSRKLFQYNQALKKGIWRRDIWGNGLDEKTIGFIGFGGIARQLAKYLSGFSCQFLVYDAYLSASEIESFGARPVTLDELAAQSDIISIHCPLVPETKGLINMGFLAKMKPTAILVNTARGPIVKEADLIAALQQGIIAGAGLDVYESEPLAPTSPLLQMDNIFITPHIGSFTIESNFLTRSIALDNIVDFIAGKIPRNCLNPDYRNHVK